MKSKSTATVLAFFLGGFGVHRFYLNQAGLGIAYLLFCWTLVPAIIAFIDFVCFLSYSSPEFDKKYNGATFPVKSAASRNRYSLTKDVRNLFQINFGKIPNANWKYEGVDGNGESIHKKYSRKLQRKEFEIFDYAVLRQFNDGSKNVTFYSSKFDMPTYSQMRLLIDTFFMTLGKDDMGVGKWDHIDEDEITEAHWRGRQWYDHNPPVSISKYDDGRGYNQFDLTIMGV